MRVLTRNILWKLYISFMLGKTWENSFMNQICMRESMKVYEAKPSFFSKLHWNLLEGCNLSCHRSKLKSSRDYFLTLKQTFRLIINGSNQQKLRSNLGCCKFILTVMNVSRLHCSLKASFWGNSGLEVLGQHNSELHW